MKEIISILVIIALLAYIVYKIYVTEKWWKASSKYVKEKMQIGDEVHISTTDSGVIAKVLKIEEETVDVVVTVRKSRIYLKH